MTHDPPVMLCDQQEPGRIIYAAGKALRSELPRPIDVHARVTRPGILREQRAATRDQSICIGSPGTANDGPMLSITHTPTR